MAKKKTSHSADSKRIISDTQRKAATSTIEVITIHPVIRARVRKILKERGFKKYQNA